MTEKTCYTRIFNTVIPELFKRRIPFKTKVDINRYEDFSGVVGAFSRLLSDTTLKGGVNKENLYAGMREKVDCSDEDFDKLFNIVENVYFENDTLLPVNARSLNYINSNISQC